MSVKKTEKIIDGLTYSEWQELEALRSAVLVTPRQCLVEGCGQNTIKGHVLAKVHLKGLSDHVYVLHTVPQHKRVLAYRYGFRKIGVNEIKETEHGMQAFCQSCDSKIFAPIEISSGDVDFSDYEQNLLFSLKAVAHEYIKQDNWLMVYERMKVNPVLAKMYTHQTERQMVEFKQSMLFMRAEITKLINSLKNGDSLYEYITLTYPRFEFFMNGSCLISGTIFKADGLFLNVVPQAHQTIVSIGGCKEVALKYINHAYAAASKKGGVGCIWLKTISDFAVKYMEIWGCSERFYSDVIAPFRFNTLSGIDSCFVPGAKDIGCSPSVNIFAPLKSFSVQGEGLVK